MFLIRRLVWFTTGATAGFGGAMWIRRRVLRRIEQVVPPSVSAAAGRSARRVAGRVGDAVADGREAARGREAELRAQLRPGAGHEAPQIGPAALSTRPGARPQ